MRLHELKEIVESQHYDVEELVGLLELSVDDILERFPDKLTENASKFGVEEHDNDQ